MTDESAAPPLHLVASPPFCLAAAANGWHTLADPQKAADGLDEERFRHLRFCECHALLISYGGVQLTSQPLQDRGHS